MIVWLSVRQLFDVLIPFHALANASAQLPLARFRSCIDALLQLADALANDLPVFHRKLSVAVHGFVRQLEISGDRAPETPIVCQQGTDDRSVDRFVVAVTDRVLSQEHDRVDDVFFIDLGDLHLLHQQLCQG